MAEEITLDPIIVPMLKAECGCNVDPGESIFLFCGKWICFDCLINEFIDMGPEKFGFKYGAFKAEEAGYENVHCKKEYI